MYCKFCGAKIDDEAKFCTKCGKNTEEAFEVEETSQIRDSKSLLKVLIPVFAILLFGIIGLTVKNIATKDEKVKVENNEEIEDASDKSGQETDVTSADTEKSNGVAKEEFRTADKEDNSVVTSELIEETANYEPYQIRLNFGVGEKDSEPKIMGFDFEVDGKWVSTEDLTCDYSQGSLYREITREISPGSKNKKQYVKLSPEHLKEVRNVFIEAYDTYFKDYEDNLCEAAIDFSMFTIEVNKGVPKQFQINIDGKSVNFILERCSQGQWSNHGSSSENEHTYTTELIIDTEVEGLSDFTSYIEGVIIEDEDKEFSYDDYGIVNNTIQLDTDETESAIDQGEDNENDDGNNASSIVGTWYSTSDATVITFDENGNYTSNNPNTGEHTSLPYYNASGNRYTVYCEDYYDFDYYLKGDTLEGEEGMYKRK